MKIITQGISRIVFVHKDTAIKFPYINFFRVFKNFLKYKKEGRLNEKIKSFHQNKVLAVFIFLLHAISSNRREYLYFKKHSKEKSLLPVKGFLFGYIIVQPRVDILNKEDLRWKKVLEKLEKQQVKDIDLLKPENFCIWGKTVRLLDYGSNLTQKTLNVSGFQIINE